MFGTWLAGLRKLVWWVYFRDHDRSIEVAVMSLSGLSFCYTIYLLTFLLIYLHLDIENNNVGLEGRVKCESASG